MIQVVNVFLNFSRCAECLMAVVPPIDQFQKDSKKDDSIKVPLLIVRIDGIIYNTRKIFFM